MESLKQSIEERFSLIKRFSELQYCCCPKCGREWKTKIVNGVKTYDLKGRCECGCVKYETVELINNADFSIPILTDLATAYRNEIHEFLVPSNIPDKEEIIRSYIRDIMTVVLPLVRKQKEALEAQYKSKTPKVRTVPYNKLEKALTAFYQLEDDYTALVAFRHFETFVLYIDKHVYASDIFTPALHLFKGFYYFANSMALKKDVRFIEKQCFAGAGKSATDSIFMTWLFGIDINNDVLKYFGSKANIIQTIDMVTHIMVSPQYAKVFPYYAKFDCNPNNMFDMLKTTDGVMKISGSIKAVNLRVCAKGDNKDGIRAKYLFLDDITLAPDAEKVEKHEFDKYLYTARWFKRKYDLNNFFIIASGTTYHQQDILSYLKGIFGIDNAKPTKFKFTSVGKSNEIVPNGISVFCVIYGLDENGKSTFEKRFPTEQFLLEQAKNPRNFAAMVQQQPQPPEGAPFDYDNLPNQYGKEGIPHYPDRSQEVCRASLDPARKGFDFNSMPIINEIDGELFLQDCIYERCPPDRLPEKVVAMIEKHHIVQLDIENNTDTTFDVLIKKLLAERGITYCAVSSFFSYKKKGDKITDCETSIKKVHYPKSECYTQKSPMGLFMRDLTGYSYDVKVKHDDSVDSLANYSLRFIINKQRGAKVSVLKGRRYA